MKADDDGGDGDDDGETDCAAVRLIAIMKMNVMLVSMQTEEEIRSMSRNGSESAASVITLRYLALLYELSLIVKNCQICQTLLLYNARHNTIE